jgi:hypothetical protein
METSDMLRITNMAPGQFALTGRLVEGWVDELARVVDGVDSPTVHLDLRDVTYVDRRGVLLLRQLSSGGALVHNASVFVTTLVWGGEHDGAH